MLKKLLYVTLLTVLLGAFSCGDGDPVAPAEDHSKVEKPGKASSNSASRLTTRTIFINGKKQSTGEQADVYYQVNVGGWNYLGTLSTSCTNLGSFQANDGDFVYIAVTETSTGDAVWYWINENSATCPNSKLSSYCGSMEEGQVDYSYEVSASVTLSLTARVRSDTGELWNCYF